MGTSSKHQQHACDGHPASQRVRTCIGCGAQRRKDDLIRIVKTSEGEISYDANGHSAGRGAYVCSIDCFERARASHRLDRALKIKVADQDYEMIADELRRARLSAQG
ncbi:MAG: YlxR family protein [Eggerthellaceae bacterium]|nr:YlxR family protein [Eggerthellaceae bacterium]MCH4221521.1 YlxR family protein [Eggerthellaceae bacterium]